MYLPGVRGVRQTSEVPGQWMGLPTVELDKYFWRPDLTPIPKEQRVAVKRQRRVAETSASPSAAYLSARCCPTTTRTGYDEDVVAW